MPYEKQEWIDRLVADDNPKLVLREGSLLEAQRFNHMEDGIGDCDAAITALNGRVTQIQETTTLIEERGFVASVTYIVDEEEDEKFLKFVMSNGSELTVPLTTKIYYQVNYYDGSILLFSESVRSERDATYDGIPTRPHTPHYDYDFLG